MLLPSALPCDIIMASQRPQRPKLLSFSAYAPQQPESYTGGLIASCRALHSILGGPQPSISQSQLQPRQPQQCALSTSSESNVIMSKKLSSPPRIITPPRGLNKRRREEYEQDEHEKENIPQSPRDQDLFQTPKRRRRQPLDMPLGLNAADFASLNTPARTTPRREKDETIEMPPLTVTKTSQSADSNDHNTMSLPIQTRSRRRSSARSQQNDRPPDLNPMRPHNSNRDQWSPLDDRRLVEIVLSKLSLSKRDWNDCAKQLGKDKDSLDRRWRMLIGEGNVGLRRGLGRHERGDLDIQSW